MVYLDDAGNVLRIYDDSTENMKFGPKQPLFTSVQANNVAESSLGKMQADDSSARLVWFRKIDVGKLAWQVETQLVPCQEPCAPTHVLTTVDAMNGEILSQWQRGGNAPSVDPKTGVQTVPIAPVVINDTAGTGPGSGQWSSISCRLQSNKWSLQWYSDCSERRYWRPPLQRSTRSDG